MRNSNKSNALLNIITLLVVGSALLVSFHALAADVGVGVGINGGIDRGVGAVDAGVKGNAAGVGKIDANGGVIASPPETHGKINADGTVSINRDGASERADGVRRKARDATRDKHLPKPRVNGEAGGAVDISK